MRIAVSNIVKVYFLEQPTVRDFYWFGCGTDRSLYFGSVVRFKRGFSAHNVPIPKGGRRIEPARDGLPVDPAYLSGSKYSYHASGVLALPRTDSGLA